MKITTFNAFRSRNYRLFFSGQSVSLMGTWMQRTAVYWIIYVQTHSAFMLGLGVFAIQFPAFLFSLLGGAVADKYSKYKVLLITQILSMVQAVILTAVVLFTDYTVTEVLTLSVMLGIINAFDVPARQSLVHFMVDDKKDLGNAIALNSSMVNLARLIGPAIAGILLEEVGAGLCFLLNAASFMAVIISLLMMRLPAYIPPANTPRIMEGLKQGMSYLKSVPSIGMLVLFLALSSFFVLPYDTLFSVVAKTTLNGDASTFGYLNSFTGIGAFAGAVFLASLRVGTNLKKLLISAAIIMGLALIVFSQTYVLFFALAVAAVIGFSRMFLITLSNTILQTTTSQEMRGRVLSYFAMSLFGMNPLGALMIGSVSQYAGSSVTFLVQGGIALLIAAVFFPYFWKGKNGMAKEIHFTGDNGH